MTLREGSRVSFVGDEGDGLRIGDEGRVLSEAGDGAHILWSTGQRAGEITLCRELDVVEGAAQVVTYPEEAGTGLVTFAVRTVFDRHGYVGLVNALNDEGHFATLASVAEEALSFVSSRLYADPSIREVLAHLEADEGAEFVDFTAAILLRDAFTAEGD